MYIITHLTIICTIDSVQPHTLFNNTLHVRRLIRFLFYFASIVFFLCTIVDKINSRKNMF